MEATQYNAWYQTPRGIWLSELEFQLITQLLQPTAGESLLDVGCGTGHFTRCFANMGLHVTGLDPDASMLAFAEKQASNIKYLKGSATNIPLSDNSFDYTIAVTSLCFINDPIQVIKEMWRVTNKKLVLGLLNKNSLLYLQKHNKGGYTGARWDTKRSVENWFNVSSIKPTTTTYSSVINIPFNNVAARLIEYIIPKQFLYGGFLAVCLSKE